MIKWLKAFRKKHWPTPEEEYERGIQFAKDTLSALGRGSGTAYLWNVSRDHDDPFDRGIIDYINEVEAKYKWSS